MLPGTKPPHAYVVRMDGPTSKVLWVRSLGSVAGVNATRLAVDKGSKALYVTGPGFLSLPPSEGEGIGSVSTVLRLDTESGVVVWAKSVPQVWAVAMQPGSGQPFVAGSVHVVCVGVGCMREAKGGGERRREGEARRLSLWPSVLNKHPNQPHTAPSSSPPPTRPPTPYSPLCPPPRWTATST